MPSVPLSLIRQHLVVDHSDDDQLLTHYAGVAEVWIAAYVGAPFDPDSPLMTQAALLMIATQYETREAITFSNPYQLPYGVHDLLSPLKTRITGYTAPAEDDDEEPGAAA